MGRDTLRLRDGLDGLGFGSRPGKFSPRTRSRRHCHEAQVLFLGALAAAANFATEPVGVALETGRRYWSTPGFQHQHVHVLVHGEHVVQAAVADVVGPAVAAEDPLGFLDHQVAHGEDFPGNGAAFAGQGAAQRRRGGFGALRVVRAASRLHSFPDGAVGRGGGKLLHQGGQALPRWRVARFMPNRTPRCPRTGSWPRPGPDPGLLRVGAGGGAAAEMEVQPVALATIMRSPNNWVTSLM